MIIDPPAVAGGEGQHHPGLCRRRDESDPGAFFTPANTPETPFPRMVRQEPGRFQLEGTLEHTVQIWPGQGLLPAIRAEDMHEDDISDARCPGFSADVGIAVAEVLWRR